MNDSYNMNIPPESYHSPVGEQAGVQLPVCRRTLTTDLSGDFSLPDYQPEIKRLLRVGVSIPSPEVYTSGDNVDLDGTMDYFVLYMGNDNQLYCAPLSTNYRMSLSLSDEREREKDHGRPLGAPSPLDGELTCTCDVTAEPVTGRVTSPRHLNIKSRLKAAVKVYGTCQLSTNSQGEPMPDSVERLSATAPTACLFRGTGEPLALQDDMILNAADGGEQRVVCAEGQVMIHETAAGQNTVTCRGDVLLKLTLCPAEVAEGEDALPVISTRKIPFSQVVEVPGVTPDCACCARGACTEMSIEVEEGHLHSDLGVVLEVMAQKEQAAAFTKDLYSTRKETKGGYATYPTQRALGCFNGNFTLSDSLTLSDVGIHPSSRVMDVTATAYPEAITADAAKNRCVLTGRCRIHLLLYREGEYNAAELELPFRYEKEMGTMGKLAEGVLPEFDGSVKAVSCRARMDGERVGIDAELAVALRLTAPDSLTTLASVTFGEDVTRRRGEYVICFPAADDTLWSVAKRYHAPLVPLGAANGLSLPEEPDKAGSLEGTEYLIV